MPTPIQLHDVNVRFQSIIKIENKGSPLNFSYNSSPKVIKRYAPTFLCFVARELR